MPRHDEGFFTARDNVRLFWESLLPEGAPRAHVGIVHGYAEHCGRYRWTMEQLAGQGLGVHAFDYRGHGQADGRRGHCDAFEDFLEDLDAFWRRVVAQAEGRPCFLLAHSHGALMAIQWLRRSPPRVRGVVLSAPYLELAFTPPALQYWSGRFVGLFLPRLSQRLPLDMAQLTHDPVIQERTAKDPLYNRVFTVGWFTESLKARRAAQQAGPELSLPVFLLVGSKDPVASSNTSRRFFETIASTNKKFKEYAQMLHEPLNEVGKEEVMKDISGWILAQL